MAALQSRVVSADDSGSGNGSGNDAAGSTGKFRPGTRCANVWQDCAFLRNDPVAFKREVRRRYDDRKRARRKASGSTPAEISANARDIELRRAHARIAYLNRKVEQQRKDEVELARHYQDTANRQSENPDPVPHPVGAPPPPPLPREPAPPPEQ